MGSGALLLLVFDLADRIETAWNINRIPDSRTPGRLASDRALRQLSRHYPRHYQTLSQLAASGAGIAADCSSCMLVRYC